MATFTDIFDRSIIDPMFKSDYDAQYPVLARTLDSRGTLVTPIGHNGHHMIIVSQHKRLARVYGSEEDLTNMLCELMRNDVTTIINGIVKQYKNVLPGRVYLEEYRLSDLPASYRKRMQGKDAAHWDNSLALHTKRDKSGEPVLVRGELVLQFHSYDHEGKREDSTVSELPELRFTLDAGFGN